MGFFHEVPGGCGDLARAEHVVFQRQRAEVCCGSCLRRVCGVLDAVCTFVRTLFQRPPFPPVALTCLRPYNDSSNSFSVCLQGNYF